MDPELDFGGHLNLFVLPKFTGQYKKVVLFMNFSADVKFDAKNALRGD